MYGGGAQSITPEVVGSDVLRLTLLNGCPWVPGLACWSLLISHTASVRMSTDTEPAHPAADLTKGGFLFQRAVCS